MFYNNKYKKIYYRIIERAKLREHKTGYFERHHIIPKSIGGERKEKNLVYLTAKEHYICHVLLMKMVKKKKDKKSMAFALFRFGQCNKLNNRKMTAKSFQKYRELYAKNCSGKNNPFYGKKHSEKTKVIIKQKNIEWCKLHGNSFLGKHHTEEYKINASRNVSIPIIVKFFDGRCVTFLNRLELGTFLGKSKSLGAKLVYTKGIEVTPTPGVSFNLWKKYGIKGIQKTNVDKIY